MVLTLVGSTSSTCSLRVAMVLHEKKVPFEFIPIDLAKGEHKAPPYMEKQPFGVVPYIDDDGFILYESRAICHYIASKYAGQGNDTLIPSSDLKAIALFHQAASTELCHFNDFAEKIVVERVFKPMNGLATDEEHVKRLLATLEYKLDAYDKILGKQKYLAGNTFTLADLFHIPYGALLPVAGAPALDLDKRPNVARWWKDITSRPTWNAVKDGVKAHTGAY
ncbi:Glutathione S-transferase [Psilocybe cubensis]|uniref:glutathione transferase n=3 Tax=Psilocybe cubensis TaxID=181762 RepID=A0A8H7Y2G6_PSICU|nr:Glutathione S-transferase [Psilocybe cubensis]XP_047748627.1 Glutathione S-transferase [Psilocybe cubensis]KAH9480986.1 Glutathione S-transferase [Psilocybe cubensis]KAH9481002.1 Glutathione S-transferase [Psilocybe cubensis]